MPQFLADVDAAAFHLPAADAALGRHRAGRAAATPRAPAPISSFAALDAILAKLADRTLFPDLTTIVVAGHSGGGQVVQRYAILGQGEAAPIAAGIAVRYVVANPSSYAYFSADRPDGEGGFALRRRRRLPEIRPLEMRHGRAARLCRGGDAGGAGAGLSRPRRHLSAGHRRHRPEPPGAGQDLHGGGAGPYRLARGEAYMQYLRGRHPDGFRQRLLLVQGVGH